MHRHRKFFNCGGAAFFSISIIMFIGFVCVCVYVAMILISRWILNKMSKCMYLRLKLRSDSTKEEISSARWRQSRIHLLRLNVVASARIFSYFHFRYVQISTYLSFGWHSKRFCSLPPCILPHGIIDYYKTISIPRIKWLTEFFIGGTTNYMNNKRKWCVWMKDDSRKQCTKSSVISLHLLLSAT